MNKKPLICTLIISFLVKCTDAHFVRATLIVDKNALRPASTVVAQGKVIIPPPGCQTTILFKQHVKRGATMDAFGKWWMPIHYGNAEQENLNTRYGVSIFDESHMGLIDIEGESAAEFIDYISSPNKNKDGIRPFNIGDVQYRYLYDANGDCLDDIEVVKLEDNHFRLVVNACNTDKVKTWLGETLREYMQSYGCEMTDLRYAPDEQDQRIILALQGTNGAQYILQQLTDFDLESIGYFKAAFVDLNINGRKVKRLVQRSGYTGEDGFEIHLHPEEAVAFWRKVIELGARPAGLEARDSLRLEAGLPLYGHEWLTKGGPMPFEYRFGFALNLRNDGNFKATYIGKGKLIERQKTSTKALAGIRVLDRRSIPSNGNDAFDEEGNKIGYVTSGVFSPSLQTSIGLVYIDKKHAQPGTIIKIKIAGEDTLAKVVETPFINHIISDRARDPRENAPFYIPGGDDERAIKLALIKEKFGVDSVDGLFGDLQRYFSTRPLNIPTPMSIRELFGLLYGLSVKDISDLTYFIGAGYYNEPDSDLVKYLLSKYGITTSYTPYQSAVSQGNLRLMFLYQSLMAKLLGMDVVNASLYDGASALAEGVRMAANATDKKKILVAGAINPRHRAVLDTYAKNSGLEIIYIPQDKETGRIDINRLKANVTKGDIASIVVQQPNFLGILETEIDKVAEIAKKNKLLLHIHSNDPLAFVRVRPPGSYDADIATAEGQAFVGGPYYGGNSLGIIACKRMHVLDIPGRLVGQTHDSAEHTAFALALTHREQHVGRKNATSNICTNAALNALCTAAYILDMGKGGLDGITGNSHQSAMRFAEEIVKIQGFRVCGSGPIFREVVVESAIPADILVEELAKSDIGVSRFIQSGPDSDDKNLVQFSFTGRHTSKDLRDLIEALQKIAADPSIVKTQLITEGGNLVEIPGDLSRESDTEHVLDIPNISEPILRDIIDEQSRLNYNPIDNPCPLGSCTMMYNPFVNELIAWLEAFIQLHPYQTNLPQGTLKILYDLGIYLQELTGMDAASLNPAAGAHGEFAGLTAIFRYHESKGDLDRKVVITTDSSHGTNPASTAMADAEVVEVKTDPETGRLSINDLKRVLAENDGKVAAIMLTEPNTLGLFEDLETAARLVHDAEGLVYMDGANLNAIVGRIRPGDLGVDVIHVNLHKTFSTPHGSGGPGAGPICVKSELRDFLPNPRVGVTTREGKPFYYYEDDPDGVHIGSFLGNIGVIIRAYAYIRALGQEGLRAASGDAVLNAAYLMARLIDHFDIPYAPGKLRMHEFVISIQKILDETGVSANDFAKRLEDFGIHPPTVNFPLIVKEAMMFEPTQSMSLADLDRIANAMISIKKEAYTEPHCVTDAPFKAPVRRVDDEAVQDEGVPLKNDDIQAILGIGDEALIPEKPSSVEKLLDYEDPMPGWKEDRSESIPNEVDEEWYRIIEIDGRPHAVVGLTQHTVDELNKKSKKRDSIKRVFPPKIGTEIVEGQTCAKMLTSKADKDINAPATGRVVKINTFACKYTADVNNDPYGRGWLFVVELTEEPAVKKGGKIESDVARVGITEQDAEGVPGISAVGFPFVNLGMAHVMGKTRGFVKIFIDDTTRRILGAHIKGAHAKKLIKVIDLAMRLDANGYNVRIEDLADLIYAHPTLPEAIGEAAEAALDKSVHTMPDEKRIPPKSDVYDLLIAGAGPAGYVAAIRAAQLGQKVAVVEKDYYGGTCLNRGCIPTKAILEYIKQHEGSGPISLEDLRAKVEAVVGGLRNGIDALFKANGVEVIEGDFNMKDAKREQGGWKISVNDSGYDAKNLMLAMGSSPATLPGLTIDHKKIIDSNDALALKEIPEKITIVGAGAIGLEFARIYKALGSEVTVVEMAEQVCPGILDKDMAERLQRDVEKQGITFRLNTAFDTKRIPSGTILVAVGRRPNTAGMEKETSLAKTGEIMVDDQYRVRTLEGGAEGAGAYSPNLFAVGDNIAIERGDETVRLPLLAHKASKEAKIAVENIAADEVKNTLNYNGIPSVVFTNPELASVGLTEARAKAGGREVDVQYFSYPDDNSFVKAVVDNESKSVLSFQIIGPAAPYAIAEMSLAVKMGARLHEFIGGAEIQPLSPDTGKASGKTTAAALRRIESSA